MKTLRIKIPIEWSAPRPALVGDETSPSPDQFECEVKVLPTFPCGRRARIVRILKLASGGGDTIDLRVRRFSAALAGRRRLAMPPRQLPRIFHRPAASLWPQHSARPDRVLTR